MFKAYRNTADGHEHVLDFLAPGEFIGLPGIYQDHYFSDYVALMKSGHGVISYAALIKLSGEIGGLFQHSMRLMSKHLLRQEVLAGNFGADERVAAFLLNMSRRLGHVGFPLQTVRLPMPWRDIANYLRLAPETVSRIFTQYARCDLILVKDQTISLLDMVGLAKVGRDLDLS